MFSVLKLSSCPSPLAQVVGGRLAAVHGHLWIRWATEADGAVCSHCVRGGKGAPPLGVQTSP